MGSVIASSAPVYIVDGARTPFLKARGGPGAFSASDLATQAGRALLLRQPVRPSDLSEVILGCAAPAPDEVNIGRVVALRMGCGEKVPGFTVMRNCASGLQAIDSAMANIQRGRSDLVLAGGVDALSRTPLIYNDTMVRWFSAMAAKKTTAAKLGQFLKLPVGAALQPVIAILKGLTDPVVGLSMGQTAENLAYRFGITRQDMDAYANQSHHRVVTARDTGIFSNEIVPIVDNRGTVYKDDDGVRGDSTEEGLAKLRPVFDRPYGNITAGNSSQVTDGAAWVLLASEAAVERFGLSPIARIVDLHWAGLDPAEMGLGPVHAATPLLQRHGLGLNDLDQWEINEAFAAQVLGCLKAWQDAEYCRTQLGCAPMGTLDESRLNLHGGAIAIGHPVGASGTRIVLHLARSLREKAGAHREGHNKAQSDAQNEAPNPASGDTPNRHSTLRGMAAICIGGGLGGAALVEAV
ncbi:MAG: acetyl-CoA C-acetyltransferase [Burkholderiaceae bacterium]